MVGIFLFDAARGIIRDVRAMQHDIVDDSMKLAITVSPDRSVQYVIDHVLTLARQPVFPVAVDKQLFGMLLLRDIKGLERSAWRDTLVRDVMRPVRDDYFVETGTVLAEVQMQMRSNDIGAVAVVDSHGKLVGCL